MGEGVSDIVGLAEGVRVCEVVTLPLGDCVEVGVAVALGLSELVFVCVMLRVGLDDAVSVDVTVVLGETVADGDDDRLAVCVML